MALILFCLSYSLKAWWSCWMSMSRRLRLETECHLGRGKKSLRDLLGLEKDRRDKCLSLRCRKWEGSSSWTCCWGVKRLGDSGSLMSLNDDKFPCDLMPVSNELFKSRVFLGYFCFDSNAIKFSLLSVITDMNSSWLFSSSVALSEQKMSADLGLFCSKANDSEPKYSSRSSKSSNSNDGNVNWRDEWLISSDELVGGSIQMCWSLWGSTIQSVSQYNEGSSKFKIMNKSKQTQRYLSQFWEMGYMKITID